MFFLSIKQLLSRPGRTFLALLGIIFGTAAFFILSSTMLGFRELLIQRIINNNAHIRISAEENIVKEHSLD
ncbi:MAG: ABC transporter permease, partial [Spirochaetia bacterium]|nr:ABC transporter permease [Spirochaetia bacterium]